MENKNKILLGVAIIFLLVIGAAVVEVYAQTQTNQTSAAPDLVVTDLALSNYNPQRNEAFTVTFTVTNKGTADIDATQPPYGAGYYLYRNDPIHGDSIQAGGVLKSLNVGESQTLSFQTSISASPAKIYVVIDRENTYAELDETNNEKSQMIYWPDLVVTDMKLYQSDFKIGDDPDGIATIKNIGNADTAREVSLRVYKTDSSGTVLLGTSTRKFRAGESFDIDIGSRIAYSPTTFKVVIDSENLVSEADETNNEKSLTIYAASSSTSSGGGGGTATNQTSTGGGGSGGGTGSGGGGGGGYATNPFSISPSSGQLGTEVYYTVGNAAGSYPYQIYFNGILVASQLPSGGYVTGSFKVTKDIGAIVGDNKITLKWSGNGEIRGTTYFTLTGGIEPPKPIPIYPALSLDVSTDKYYYTAGEQVKVSATLTGEGNLGTAVVTAYVYKPTYCPEGAVCIAGFPSEPITFQLIGGVAQACEVHGDVVTCPTTQSYYYVGYYTPRSSGNHIIDASATLNGMSISDSTKFEVIGKAIDVTDYDAVDLSISPEEQKTIIGEPVTYLLTIRDKHSSLPSPLGGGLHGDPLPFYTYNLEVFGLPYYASYPSQVTVSVGETEQVRMTVYPSSTAIQQTVTAVAEPVPLAQQVVTEPAAPTVRPISAEEERLTTKVTAQVISITQKIDPRTGIGVEPTRESAVESAIAIHPEYRDETYQSSVRFTVKATQSDNDRNADKATGVLHVVYYRPPAPPEEPPELPEVEVVTLSFAKGWNLINLPGEYVRSEQSSTCGSLTGFVYLNGRGYVKLDRIKDVIGSGFLKYFSTHSFWVYAEQSCEIKVLVSNFATYSGLKLDKGWNFLGTTKDMVGETLDSIKGTCNIVKVYTFSTYANKWGRFGTDNLITTPYNGVLVKTSGECTLGENTILPPPLPQD